MPVGRSRIKFTTYSRHSVRWVGGGSTFSPKVVFAPSTVLHRIALPQMWPSKISGGSRSIGCMGKIIFLALVVLHPIASQFLVTLRKHVDWLRNVHKIGLQYCVQIHLHLH